MTHLRFLIFRSQKADMQNFLDLFSFAPTPAHFLRPRSRPRIFRLPLCGISPAGALDCKERHGALSANPV